MTLTLEIDPDLEAGLRARAERAGLPPERFVLRLLGEWCSPELAPGCVSATEARLLQRIGEGLPPSTWARYEALKEKRDAQTLTDPEYAELIQLIDEVECWNAARWEAVVELAKLRGVPFTDVVQELGVGPRGQ